MRELTATQRQQLDSGDPVLTEIDGRQVVLLSHAMHQEIARVIDMERSRILGGHTRGHVEPPEPLTPLSVNGTEEYVQLDAGRWQEIVETIAAVREEENWTKAVADTRAQMLRDDEAA
jgi:hypothetical protein